MIINKDFYYCAKCKKAYSFDTSKPYSKLCPICNTEMDFDSNLDCNTELAEQRANTQSYDPTTDPNSPYYIPKVTCPYCKSINTKKISTMSKAGSIALFGVFAASKVSKNYHCNRCGSDF